MNRIKALREYIDDVFANIDDGKNRGRAYAHTYGVALACAFIAKKRGLDAELATIAGMLHDFFEYENYKTHDSYSPDHGIIAADYARGILGELGITTQDETNIICAAITAHAEEDAEGGEYDEILKDADVFEHCFFDVTYPVRPHEKERYVKLLREFGMK